MSVVVAQMEFQVWKCLKFGLSKEININSPYSNRIRSIWVPEPTDLYKLGTNNSGLYATQNGDLGKFLEDRIEVAYAVTQSRGFILRTTSKYDLSQYKSLKFEFMITRFYSTSSISPSSVIELLYPNKVYLEERNKLVNVKYISTLNISSLSAYSDLQFEFRGSASNSVNAMQIYKIWVE